MQNSEFNNFSNVSGINLNQSRCKWCEAWSLWVYMIVEVAEWRFQISSYTSCKFISSSKRRAYYVPLVVPLFNKWI